MPSLGKQSKHSAVTVAEEELWKSIWETNG